MVKYIFILFVIILNNFQFLVTSARVKRIVYGQDVACNTYPNVASLTGSHSNHLCGATLVSSTVAITAAHCVEESAEQYSLELYNYCSSDSTKLRIDVLGIIMHPLYRWYDNAHDIALLRIELNVEAEVNWINANILPTSSFGVSGDCTALGYGTRALHSAETWTTLSSTVQTIISLDACIEKLGPYVAPRNDAGLMCAMGQGDACDGDSGGPLMCEGVLEGVISYGQSCGVPDLPGVYTSIRAHIGWINEHL